MILGHKIQSLLMEVLPIKESAEGVSVPTHCLFPDGQHVVLNVAKGHGEKFILTDDGQAYSVVKEAGIELSSRHISKASELARLYGADFSSGRFTLNGISLDQVPAAIFSLANLVQHWASGLILAHEAVKETQLKGQVYEKLAALFTPSVLDKEYEMLGESNKHYKFDYRVKLSTSNYMLIDVISNHPYSISSAFQRNYDVKKAANENYLQEGIIENQKGWKGEDINLLHDVLDGIVPLESDLQPLSKYAVR